jgi:formate-dependent nitrite reductase membrane component NrfD
MAGVTIASTGRSGRQAVASRLAVLARAMERTGGRRKIDVRQVMLFVGATLMGLGFVAIVLGWFGAAHSAFLFQEIPYLISGGLLGVALVVGGGFLFFATWLVRLIEENRRYTMRVAQTLDRVDRALRAVATDAAAAAAFPTATGNGFDAEGAPAAPSGSAPPAPGSSAGGGWA